MKFWVLKENLRRTRFLINIRSLDLRVEIRVGSEIRLNWDLKKKIDNLIIREWTCHGLDLENTSW